MRLKHNNCVTLGHFFICLFTIMGVILKKKTLNLRLTMTFLVKLFLEVRRVNICLSNFGHFLPIFWDISSYNSNLAHLGPHVLYSFGKLLV